MEPPRVDRLDQSTWVELSVEPGGAVSQPTPEPPPPWLSAAIEPVLEDLLTAEDALAFLGYTSDAELEHWGLVHFREPNGWEFGFGIGGEDGVAALQVKLAEGLQNNLPEVATSWGQARPPCPGHGHPARPVEHGRTAWWSCPESDWLLVPMGRAKELVAQSEC